MSEKKISYLNRNFEDYRQALKNLIVEYYPQIASDFDDASIGSWLIDIIASVGDNLSFYIDRAYSETNLDSAQQASSVYAMARNCGLKIPGPTASIAEEEFVCTLPVLSDNGMPAWEYAPIIKKGSQLTNGSQVFEVMDDIYFSEQFNSDGVSNRTLTPQRNGNGVITSYEVRKTELISAGETKIYSQFINANDITPFMEVILPFQNVMNIESIIFKDGTNFATLPEINEFMINSEHSAPEENPTKTDIYRFFEVNSLVEQYRWGDADENNGGVYKYGYLDNNNVIIPTMAVTKGEWKTLTQKFITEYTDSGYMKIIFGSGEPVGQNSDLYSDADTYTKYQVTKMIRNNFLGRLPQADWTMFVLYRTGGGKASNVAKGTINQISKFNGEIGKDFGEGSVPQIRANVKNSIRVTNITPSISGKDKPTIDEIKTMIKYNAGSQDRCVTVKDYESRVIKMPPKYGCPFRVRATEENNKIIIYMLGVDNNGKLSTIIPEQLARNLMNYISMYRSLNDYVEMKGGRIINISVECDVFVDKNYHVSDVVLKVINTIKDYMDVNKFSMGENIFIGDLQKEIGKIDGIVNLIDIRIFNEYGDDYSSSRTSQSVINNMESDRDEIDLEENDYILNGDKDEMFEIKYPEKDIRVRAKTI